MSKNEGCIEYTLFLGINQTETTPPPQKKRHKKASPKFTSSAYSKGYI